jgi:hypothetical protein
MPVPDIKTKFFAVVNKHLSDNSKPTIDPDDFVVNVPQVYTGSAYNRNTRLVLDAPLDSTSVGRTTIYYDRINLATITGLQVEKGAFTTLHALLPSINELMGVEFLPADVVDITLPASGTFEMAATSSNLIYSGAMTLTLII